MNVSCPLVFKLSVQNVHQLQQHTIEVSFEMTGLPYQWTPVANHSMLIARQCSARQCCSVLACISDSVPPSCPTHDNSVEWNEIWQIWWLLFMWEYLFTLKNAHLSSSSYNLWMQRNIAMKFAAYVAWILLCKHYKFGEKNCYDFRDITF